MRLCLIGDFSGTPDEGMKNVSRTIYTLLSQRHDVIAVTSRDILKPQTQARIRAFDSQIIHYLHGPTIKSLVLLKYLKMLTSEAGNSVKTIVSATRPYFSKITEKFVPYLKPDLVLTQSEKFETFFKTNGCAVTFFPNGVDLSKFAPADPDEKTTLRKQLNLPESKKIVLHVGHIKANRKLDFFMDVQKMDGVQVVVAGGTHEKADEDLKDELVRNKIIVVHEYLKDISVLYKAADLYVFPIEDDKTGMPDSYNQIGAIDLPLSILEAMGCNLPIITTQFGALPRLFNPQDGFVFAQRKELIMDLIQAMPAKLDAGTRTMVAPLDWNQVVEGLERRYRMLIKPSDIGFGYSMQPQ